MSDPAPDDDEEADFETSLAMPPLYLLRTAVRCWRCREAEFVYSLGCAAYHAGEFRSPVREFHFLHAVRSVPDALLALLKPKCPLYFFDQEEETDPPYLMNHCRCEGKLDDDFLHGDVGAAFWPDTPEGYGHFKLFRLPIEEAIPIQCDCFVGGGEYLDFSQARRLTDL